MARMISEYRIVIEGEDKNMPSDKEDRNYYTCKTLPENLAKIVSENMGESCKVMVDPVSVVVTD